MFSHLRPLYGPSQRRAFAETDESDFNETEFKREPADSTWFLVVTGRQGD